MSDDKNIPPSDATSAENSAPSSAGEPTLPEHILTPPPVAPISPIPVRQTPPPAQLPPLKAIPPSGQKERPLFDRVWIGILIFVVSAFFAFFTNGLTLKFGFFCALFMSLYFQSWRVIGGYFLSILLAILALIIACGIEGSPYH